MITLMLARGDNYEIVERFGEDAMTGDSVRQTEFGHLRRCSRPFPTQENRQTIAPSLTTI